MEKRTIIKKRKLTHAIFIEYEAVYESGGSVIRSCSQEDWDLWELKTKLIAAGISESDVEELYSTGYSNGYDEAEYNAAENGRLV